MCHIRPASPVGLAEARGAVRQAPGGAGGAVGRAALRRRALAFALCHPRVTVARDPAESLMINVLETFISGHSGVVRLLTPFPLELAGVRA